MQGENSSLLSNIFFFLLPMLSYFTGVAGVSFLFASLYTLCFYTFGTCFALFVYQLILIYRAQTVHEWRRNDFTFASASYGKFFRNFRSVFGVDNHIYIILTPFLASKMESDGLYTVDNHEHGKLM